MKLNEKQELIKTLLRIMKLYYPILSLLFMLSCSFSNKNDNLNYQYRTRTLNEKEKSLIESIDLKEKEFHNLFSSLIISEIVPNTLKLDKEKRTPISGILFCGKKIEATKIISLRQYLEKTGLTLEVSLNELSNRYFDFEFPFYSDRSEIVDTKKYYFKIYKSRDKLDFIGQIEYSQDDKSIISEVYNNWKTEIQVFPIWADQNENTLFCPLGY